ncbi:ABC transporter substrate-binding protein [Amnibacterium sp. CER49]|uniref:ABC transporter substrate-binding protein n=1 Tax=Amnibacterium sp. CER49 TaxID=3039161 RepID=UPI0024471CD8|nr:ABC transporter substrate-binding protein [Amnibacterium sp. CER49]MDH2443333.1 ABC transporter substrate-binding protein [Amnibacterium sp. CER49]
MTLTMWLNGDCPKSNCVEAPLIAGFEKANPKIKIKLVSQPISSYFQALKSASVTHRGPDIANMWPGGYMTPFLRYMANLNDFVPKSDIKQSTSTKYYAVNNDVAKAVYAVPTGDQWYVGFYNKKLLADNGISAPPQTWDELSADCKTLKSKGVLPIVNGAEYGASTMGPLPEFSYIASTLSPADWSGLYKGTVKYSDPRLQSQLQKWADLYKAGCLNKDAFNFPDPESKFEAGKAAMFLASGSWEVGNLTTKMGSNVGLLVPPYSPTPQHTLVETAGSAYAVMNYSKHEAEAGKFAAYILSDAGQKIIAKFGLPPTRPGFKTTNPLMNQLSAMSADPATQLYPMFDNYTQPGVTNALTSKLPQALVGQVPVSQALGAVDAAFAALPSSQKNVNVNLARK